MAQQQQKQQENIHTTHTQHTHSTHTHTHTQIVHIYNELQSRRNRRHSHLKDAGVMALWKEMRWRERDKQGEREVGVGVALKPLETACLLHCCLPPICFIYVSRNLQYSTLPTFYCNHFRHTRKLTLNTQLFKRKFPFNAIKLITNKILHLPGSKEGKGQAGVASGCSLFMANNNGAY